MSSPHPTISDWTRDEESGAFEAEIAGWQLSVTWTPNTAKERGYFSWKAEKDGEERRADERYEEMELAMAAAEAAVRPAA